MRLSKETWKLVSQLYASPTIWDRIIGEYSVVNLLERIGKCMELQAVAHLAGFLLHSSADVRTAAAKAIGALFDEAKPRDYACLDESSRHDWTQEWWASAAWQNLKPAYVKNFGLLPNPSRLFGLASFHGSGYVRESAIQELNKIFQGEELPFFAVKIERLGAFGSASSDGSSSS